MGLDTNRSGGPRRLPIHRKAPEPPPAYSPPVADVERLLEALPEPAAPLEKTWVEAIEALYRGVDRAIALAAPTCRQRGLCCDFDRTDHVLYASSVEVRYVKERIAAERYRLPSGNVCPLLVDGRCSARTVRMLGCRTYFCQSGWEPFGAAIYERAYARLKRIAIHFGLAWRYAPALEQFREQER